MKEKKYYPRFTLAEIEQLLDWWDGEFSNSGKLHDRLRRIRRIMKEAKN